MKKLTIFIILAVLLALGVAPAYAAEIPPLPQAFYGEVYINGRPAPAETTVEARGDGVQTGTYNPITTTESGKYGSADPLGAKLIVKGDIAPGTEISFLVNGIYVTDENGAFVTCPFQPGETTKLDLTATIAETPTATGTGTATFSSSLGSITNLTAVKEGDLPPAGKPAGVTFPHGFFSFKIINIVPWGSTVTVTITLPSAVPVGTQYWKCQNGTWYQIPIGDDDGDKVITIQLTDGGLGDAEGPPSNGAIVDPGGAGTPAGAGAGAGGGGGGGGLTLPTLRGLVSTPPIKLDAEGAITLRCVVQTTDGKLTIDIAKGTRLLDTLRRPLSSLSAELELSPPAPPSGATIVLAYNLEPNGAVFMPAITMTIEYDPTTFSEDVAEQGLYIAYWDGSKWVALKTTVNTMTRTASCQLSHLTTFALIGTVAPPAPAAFSVSALSITPAEVKPNEAVSITLSVANTGGTEGSYSVALKINGVTEAEEGVTVAPGSSQGVSFSVTREEVGSYSVDVNGLSGSFTVATGEGAAPPEGAKPPISWPLIWIIIAAAVVVGLIIFLAVRRRAY